MAAITVFGKPNCVQCTQTVRKFEREGLEAGRDFIYRDVTEDPAAYTYITEELGYSAAPVVVLTDDDHWSGMHPDNNKRAIAWALKQRESAPVEVAPAIMAKEAALAASGPEPPTPDRRTTFASTATLTPDVLDLRERLAARQTGDNTLTARMSAVPASIATPQAPLAATHQQHYHQAVVNGPQA